MLDKTRPMSLGDIFSNTFSIAGKSFGRNLVVVLILLVPAGILFAFGMQVFFTNMSDIAKTAAENSGEDVGPSMVLNALGSIMLYIFSLLIFLFCYLGATIGVTKISAGEMEGEKISVGSAFSKVFSVIYFRSMGLILLIALALMGVFIASFIIMGLLSIGDVWALKFVGVVSIIAAVGVIIYLVFRWYFAFVYVVHNDTRITDSLKKSSFLVEDYWWRTFGIIILISILVNFAVTLISTPLTFLFLWDFISQYFKVISEDTLKDNPAASLEMMKSLGFGYGMVLTLSIILQSLISPVFNVVMYFDLRIRKNDFPEAPKDEPGIGGEEITRSWELPVE